MSMEQPLTKFDIGMIFCLLVVIVLGVIVTLSLVCGRAAEPKQAEPPATRCVTVDRSGRTVSVVIISADGKTTSNVYSTSSDGRVGLGMPSDWDAPSELLEIDPTAPVGCILVDDCAGTMHIHGNGHVGTPPSYASNNIVDTVEWVEGEAAICVTTGKGKDAVHDFRYTDVQFGLRKDGSVTWRKTGGKVKETERNIKLMVNRNVDKNGVVTWHAEEIK